MIAGSTAATRYAVALRMICASLVGGAVAAIASLLDGATAGATSVVSGAAGMLAAAAGAAGGMAGGTTAALLVGALLGAAAAVAIVMVSRAAAAPTAQHARGRRHPRADADLSTLVAQSHPDAAGHVRSRAPGGAVPAA